MPLGGGRGVSGLRAPRREPFVRWALDCDLCMGSLIFITGTDTGAGKTVLTAMLLASLRARGVHALAMKPVCCGSRADARLIDRLQEHEIPIEQINPWYIPQPVAPAALAKHDRPNWRPSELERSIRELQAGCDVLLVEGCGGLMVPLLGDYFVRDLIEHLQCPVICSGRNRLGIINHMLLSARFLAESGIRKRVFVLMGTKSRTLATRTNAHVLQGFLKPDPIVELPDLGDGADKWEVVKKSAKRFKKTLALILEMATF